MSKYEPGPLPEPAAMTPRYEVVPLEEGGAMSPGGTLRARGMVAVGYTADQMHAYAAACVAAERERCAKLCLEKPGYFGSFANAELFAALIRGN